jgi:hypothetical protein
MFNAIHNTHLNQEMLHFAPAMTLPGTLPPTLGLGYTVYEHKITATKHYHHRHHHRCYCYLHWCRLSTGMDHFEHILSLSLSL